MPCSEASIITLPWDTTSDWNRTASPGTKPIGKSQRKRRIPSRREP
jgi:hypothetical protein